MNAVEEFYMVVQCFKTFNELSNTIKQKTQSYIPRHKSWLVIGDNFVVLVSSSCVSSDFLPEHFT